MLSYALNHPHQFQGVIAQSPAIQPTMPIPSTDDILKIAEVIDTFPSLGWYTIETKLDVGDLSEVGGLFLIGRKKLK
jgi:alpha-beta hydrolase superfamily lysophospholipase